jgi:hypothetical protein
MQSGTMRERLCYGSSKKIKVGVLFCSENPEYLMLRIFFILILEFMKLNLYILLFGTVAQ